MCVIVIINMVIATPYTKKLKGLEGSSQPDCGIKPHMRWQPGEIYQCPDNHPSSVPWRLFLVDSNSRYSCERPPLLCRGKTALEQECLQWLQLAGFFRPCPSIRMSAPTLTAPGCRVEQSLLSILIGLDLNLFSPDWAQSCWFYPVSLPFETLNSILFIWGKYKGKTSYLLSFPLEVERSLQIPVSFSHSPWEELEQTCSISKHL